MPGEQLWTWAVQAGAGDGHGEEGTTRRRLQRNPPPQAAPVLVGRSRGLGKAPSPMLGARGPCRRLWPQEGAPQHGQATSLLPAPAPPRFPAPGPIRLQSSASSRVRAHAAPQVLALRPNPLSLSPVRLSQLLPFPLGSQVPFLGPAPPLPRAPARPGQHRVPGGRRASLRGAAIAP